MTTSTSKTWSGKNALITGAGSGIGLALAQELAKRGAHVIVTDVDVDAVMNAMESIGEDAVPAQLDVRDAHAFRDLVNRVVEHHGHLDLLVNNAGIGVGGEVHELTVEHWNRVIDVNVKGVIHGVQAAYPHMVRRGSGHIVNVASLAGLAPTPLLVPYATSKHAVVGLSTSLRAEAAFHGVNVTVLCPAAIDTPLLDRSNPADLPPPSWKPDMRRYLGRLCSSPYPVERFAAEAVDAIQQDKAIAVIPSKARLMWRVARLLPDLAMYRARQEFERERARR